MDGLLPMGVVLVLAALGAVVYFLPTIVARKSEHVKWVFVLNLLGAWTGLLWVGAWILPHVLDRRQQLRHKGLERRLLDLARGKGGRITQEEAAAATDMTLDEAKRELERLQQAGICHLELTPEGRILYAFDAPVSAAERSAARDPLDFDLP